MSLHRPVMVEVSNRVLVAFILLIASVGFLLPSMGITPPPVYMVKPGQLELQRHSDALRLEIALLTQKQTSDQLSSYELDRLNSRLEAKNKELVAALFRERIGGVRGGRNPVPLRPAIPDLSYPIPYRSNEAVPRFFMPRLPDTSELTVKARKELFVRMMLPLILYENERIKKDRQDIQNAIDAQDTDILIEHARLYYIKDPEKMSIEALMNELVLRVQPVPTGLALTQAAVESGWGQSRFALEGNALFGQWVWNSKNGIRAADSSVTVRRFPDLSSSVRSYMRNLNTHRAYRNFRKNRARLANNDASGLSDQLLNELKSYAEIGDEYVRILRTVMKTNKFNMLDEARLETKTR